MSLLFVALLSLVGCGGDAPEAPEAAPPAEAPAEAPTPAPTEAPLTLDSWEQHPKIVEIRRIYEQIKGMQLTSATNPGCDGEMGKLTDAATGKIRSVTEVGGESEVSGRNEAYYDDQGALRFLLQIEESPEGRTERRVYLDGAGQVLWQVNRAAPAGGAPGAYAVPADGEGFPADSLERFKDADKAFAYTGCGSP